MEFPKIFVISLPERKDRRTRLQKEFKTWVNGDFDYYAPTPKTDPSWKGINMSHRYCIQEAKKRGLPWVLILEDDCTPSPNAKEQFENLLPILWERRSEWEIFNGGSNNIRNIKLIQRDPPLFSINGFASHSISLSP